MNLLIVFSVRDENFKMETFSGTKEKKKKDNELFFIDTAFKIFRFYLRTFHPTKRQKKIDSKWWKMFETFSSLSQHTKKHSCVPAAARNYVVLGKQITFPIFISFSSSLSPTTRKCLDFTAMCQSNPMVEVNAERNWNLKCLHDKHRREILKAFFLCCHVNERFSY